MGMQTVAAAPQGRTARLLAALGLQRRELRSWAMYDWANSAFITTIGAAVLPIYYSRVAAGDLSPVQATAYWGYTNSIALAIIAFASPVLGAMGDYLGAKKRFLAAFMLVGVIASAGLYFVQRGDWLLASALYVVGSIGFTGSLVFADSLLPHIARPDEIDRVSTAGYALGYLGGGVLLAINALMIAQPAVFGLADAAVASRVSFLTVAAWWLVFSVPVLRNVPEPPRRVDAGEALHGNPFAAAFGRLRTTFREIRQYRETFRFLLAFWLYIDGIHTIQRLAVIYGTELGLGQGTLIGALLLVQFIGIPCSFLFGALASRIGTRRGIDLALGVYTLIAVFGYFVREAWHFWALAFVVGLVQGGAQALSRSFYATMIPRPKSSEFFGFFSVSERFAGIVGPAVFGLVGMLTGSSRFGILALMAFFVSGMVVLSRVDEAEGRRAAAAADAALSSSTSSVIGR